MSGETRIGVIGCGFFAQNHLNAWKDLHGEGALLVAVCDRDRAKAEAAAKTFGVQHVYEDAAEMLGSGQIDLVDIITQMPTHAALAGIAAKNGIGAIVQKPFAPDLAACEAMTQAAAKMGLFLAVHENFRFQLPLRTLAGLVRAGAIGDPSWARISFRTGYNIYGGQPYLRKETRFVLLDLGVHVLDVARVLLGEVAHLSAETQRRSAPNAGEDTATVLMKHRSGAVSVVECTYESRRLPDPFPETLVEIEGPDGAIALKAGMRIELTQNGATSVIDADPPVLPWGSRPWHVIQESVEETCRHLLARFREGLPADISAEDNLRTFALAEAAYESAATGRSVVPRY